MSKPNRRRRAIISITPEDLADLIGLNQMFPNRHPHVEVYFDFDMNRVCLKFYDGNLPEVPEGGHTPMADLNTDWPTVLHGR